jgi:hypothetical protein
MRLAWNITDDEVAKVKAFVAAYSGNALVKFRIERNVTNRPAAIDRPHFWHALIACLLTTQQNSGPKSAIIRFLNSTPFCLSLDRCRACTDVAELVRRELRDFGGIRRWNTIAGEVAKNLEWLEDRYWGDVDLILNWLIGVDDAKVERNVATFIDHRFAGFGPKQARNLLQMLGLTRYETPLDSRIAKWINACGFQVTIDPKSLAGVGPYEALSDKIQELCKRAEILPCVLDAAVFASFDGNGWNEVDEILW